MIVTTWNCDKCGLKELTPDDMWEIAVSLQRCRGPSGPSGPYHQPTLRPKAVWCRACVEKAGLVPPVTPVKRAPAPPTLEDIVREIVSEEMEGGGP